MAEEWVRRWAEMPSEEARAQLGALAEEGAAGLAVLEAALAVPVLAETAVGLLGDISSQEAWDLLERAGRDDSPSLRKAARRAQHRLRSRGFSPVEQAREAVASHIEQSRASFFDQRGHQMLRVVQGASLGMVHYAEFIVSAQGLVDCAHLLAGRAEIEEYTARVDARIAGIGGGLVEIGLPYLARRVRQAVARGREQGTPTPTDYVDAVRIVEGAPEDSAPAELETLSAGGGPVSLEEVERLLTHRSMLSWAFPAEELERYVQDWQRVAERLPARTEEGVPNLAALRARGQITARIIADLCDEATCRRLKEQLPEQARLLAASGEEKLAGIAMRCAAGLEPPASPNHPFLCTLAEMSMEVALRLARQEVEEEEEQRSPWTQLEPGSLWVPRTASGETPAGEEEEPSPRLWLPREAERSGKAERSG